LAIGLTWSAPSFAKDIVLTLDQANVLARQAFIAKDFKTANALSYGVLSKRPDDAAALITVAATDPRLGFAKRGREAGRRAFKLAKDPQLKYEAAFFTAAAASTEEKFTAAKIWLRRAYHLAPTDTQKAQTSRQFRALRRRDPLSIQLQFDVSPSSNINNGSREETSFLNIFGGGQARLSVDAQALSGLQYSTSAAFQYKLNESATRRTTLNFGLSTTYYTLSSSSKADLAAEDAARVANGQSARNIDGSNFSYETIYAGINQIAIAQDGKSSLSYGLTAGQSWYGGSSLSRFLSTNLQRNQSLGPTRSIRYGISAQRQFRLDNKNNSSNIVSLSSTIAQQFKGHGLLSYGGYVRDTHSRSSQIDNTALGLSMSYRFEKPVIGKTQLELSLGLQRAEYETNAIFGDRRDNRVTASSTFIFNDVDYFGFSPTATISASRTNSTVDRFSTEKLGVNIGLRSSF
jgi:hypothetical protein